MRRAFLNLLLTFSFLLLANGSFVWASQALPAGTQIQVRLSTKLDTETAKAGQTFSGTVSQSVVVGGRTALARGATVNGRIIEAVSSGRLQRPASITLQLTSVPTEPLRIDGKSHLVRNTELIGGGTAAGALLGALAGGKKGAAIGAGLGAGAGTTTAFVTGKKEIVLPAEMQLAFVAAGGAGTSTVSSGGRWSAAPASREARTTAGQTQPSYSGGGRQPGGVGEPIFSSRDQQVIRRYYAADTENLPPGLAKRGGNLPPGLERQLQRNGTLPPGLQKRVQPFPADLQQQLTPLPAGYERVTIGARALIWDRANRILDVMVVR